MTVTMWIVSSSLDRLADAAPAEEHLAIEDGQGHRNSSPCQPMDGG
jgi:hypothetical protein